MKKNEDASEIELPTPEGWTAGIFKDFINKIPTTDKKVKECDYLEFGELPIIDQGQKFISGYCNDRNKAIACDKPVVLFGDHTRLVKFIDFAFVPGADGVKLFIPQADGDSRFFYYLSIYLSMLLPSKGYARHFQHIEKALVAFPDSTKQNKIAKKIDTLFSEIDSGVEELKKTKSNLELYKQSVLNAAIQGKLVPQDPNDEPASKLLERIRAEKEALINAGRLKKDKPLPPIDPTEVPFELPKRWEWVRLGSVCTKITDGFHNTPKRTQEGFPYIFATHVKDRYIDFSNADKVGEKDHKELYTKAFPQKGEILIVNIGAGCGDAAIIDVDYPFSFKNVAILKFSQDKIVNEYLLMYLLSVKRKNLLQLTSGGCQPFLSLTILNNMLFPLAPVDEQKRVVLEAQKMLSDQGSMTAAHKYFETKSSLLKQSILKQAFEGSLV